MNVFYFLLLNSILLSHLFAFEEEKRKELKKLVNHEISLISNLRKKDDKINYRLVELYFEKFKLEFEEENEIFLKNKKKNFAQSVKNVELIKSVLPKFIQNNKKSVYLGEVHFVLGVILRDLGFKVDSLHHFKMAYFESKGKGNTLEYNSLTSIADHNFNEKNFNESIYFYTKTLDFKNEEWLPKNVLNLSWSYFKVKNFQLAIFYSKEAFLLSKKSKSFMNVQDQAINAFSLFHVSNDDVETPFQFIKDQITENKIYLFNLVKYSLDKGVFNSTLNVLNYLKIQNLTSEDKDHLYYLLIKLFVEFKKKELLHELLDEISSFYSAIHSHKLKYFEEIVTLLYNQASFSNNMLIKFNSKEEFTSAKNELVYIQKLYQSLVRIDQSKKGLYFYLLAESFSCVGFFDKAWPFYQSSIEISKDIDLPLVKKNLDSLFKVIEYASKEFQEINQVKLYAFTTFIRYFPNDDKSPAIYEKLIYFYLEKKDIENSFHFLKEFNHHSPKLVEFQKSLLNVILDKSIEAKNDSVISLVLAHLKSGFLSFDLNFIDRIELALGSILFDNFIQFEKEGNYKKAIDGFEKIYFNKKYPTKIKFKSALKLANLELLSNNLNESLDWLKLSAEFLNDEEFEKELPGYLYFAELMLLRQNFKKASELSFFLFNRSSDFKNQVKFRLFEIHFFAEILNKDHNSCLSLMNRYSSKMDLKIKNIFKERLINSMIQSKDYFGYYKYLTFFSSKEDLDQFVISVKNWYWSETNFDSKSQLLSFLSRFSVNPNATHFLKELSPLIEFEQDLYKYQQNLERIKKFDSLNELKLLANDFFSINQFQKKTASFLTSSELEIRVYGLKLFNNHLKFLNNYLSGNRSGLIDQKRVEFLIEKNDKTIYELAKLLPPSDFLIKVSSPLFVDNFIEFKSSSKIIELFEGALK